MAFGREGSLVRLVPVDPDKHLDGCFRWLNDPQVTETLAIGSFPLSRAQEKGWLEKMAEGSQTDVVHAIELLEDGRHVGMSGIHGIDWVNRRAMTGTLIGEVDCWGKGIGTEQAQLRARYAFRVLNLRALYSEFLETNEGSKKMQHRAGYEIWGVKPQAYYKNGKYLDGVQTVLFRERWEEVFGSE
jgi:RimJ/RimL family protein N-acetyltransferase